MYVLSYLHFLAMIIFLSMTFYVIYKSPKELINWICASFIFSYALWSIAFIVMHHPNTSQETADFFLKFFSFTPYSVACFLLWFTIVFINKKNRILKSPLFYLIMLSFPVIFTYQTWIGNMLVLDQQAYGWNFKWVDSFYTFFYFFQYSLFVFITIALLIRDYRQTADYYRKNQILLIMVPTIVIYLLGTAFNVAFTLFDLTHIPQIANITALVWAFGLFYAVVKYKLLTISFSAYADKVITTMSEALILLDNNDRIVNANSAAFELFGLEREKMVGKSIKEFIKAGDELFVKPKNVNNGQLVKNRQISLTDSENREVTALFSSALLNMKGQPIGTVIALSNISQLAIAQKNLEKLNDELKEKVDELEKFQKIAVNRELKMIELKREIESLKNDSQSLTV